MTPFSQRIATYPITLDAERADDVLTSVCASLAKDEALQPAADLIERDEKVRTLLRGALTGSHYLASLARRDPAALADCLLLDPDSLFARNSTRFIAEMEAAATQKDAMRALRRHKLRTALLIALADLGGVWPTREVLRKLSVLADETVQQAVRFLFRKAAEKGEVNAPSLGAGYFVIGMGKLGSFELNYSSDIDLIVFYEAERAGLGVDVEPQKFFVRITRDLVKLLQEPTEDGYVFRTDLRLRPDPGATHIALSVEGGLNYYESLGQNWERAALIKARIVAGDIEAGAHFLRQLSPFIWRRYLDYAAIADIRAMKRRVHEFKGHGSVAVLGHNVKLGRGGIRDIEFFVQTHQLIAGGRNPDLRSRGTVDTLNHLAEGEWIKPEVAADLMEAYYFLRRVENALQIIGDQQTHVLPSDEEGFRKVAAFCSYADPEDFAGALIERFKRVEYHFETLFETLPDSGRQGPTFVFRGDEDDPETLGILSEYGFKNPREALAIVRAWQSGRYVSTRSKQAQERLGEFLPLLLRTLGRTSEPDRALATFDQVLSDLPAGLQLFSAIASNPSLLRLMADIMGTAPRLASIIAKRPALLDAVLDPGFFGAMPTPAIFRELVQNALGQASDYADLLDRARIVGREQAFLIGVRVLSGTITAEQAGEIYASLAETLVAALIEKADAELRRPHGDVPGGRAAVIAMGKLGGHEMTASSDLDLIVIYDFEGELGNTSGEKSLSGSHYYTRLTQRLIAALSAPTAEGALYEVDMRLRPSGNQGPVATRISGFVDYQQKSAWTWERLALTRARVIAGPQSLRDEIEAAIRDVLVRPIERTRAAQDVRDMREKIEAQKGTDDIWDLKQVRGGLVDLEFIAQFLQVVHAAEHPEVLDQNTEAALSKLAAAGVLSASDAELLIPAARLYHNLTQVLRLCVTGPFRPREAPQALKDLLARAVEMPDFYELESELAQVLAAVHEAFDRLIV
ncbi:bifunctional [glutamine synthetase] adenylyltransferase/[glutamine synthetase]-adenylyl-L-tyrosine phosphorylase [Methyloligella sp. 2.7D]|uniref:bifunctional [glutamine synthetase] adenylyltransferase/[glutamine synthetase]-adenylyl-L-tyrosine phosphorylase n=1 Tax=unclassified Methyloligella TaxID=2625955 RepID=UPI00157D18EE|nr:bifunctional [glutamine synthetase] adenylyltransferase/[glutamine synthetase]-adenylyl-L-tyrosine phosphorylase [Methyloligella sp. GL2]QKP77136.1 bifunctional [glutamine synthetase] adenylyltransferase/[glutamine synthetase]-adenylyl-L-tyrosine phosphorylase [Methyloligella sp. GL2]